MTEQRTKKRKRVSKNNKSAWRKYSDVKDIEDDFVERQSEIRTGGVIAEKSDASLFFVDKIKNSGRKGPRTKEEWRSKPLTCYQNLTPDPRIAPAPKGNPRGKKVNPHAATPLQILKEKEAKTKKYPGRAKDNQHDTRQRQKKQEDLVVRAKEEEEPIVNYDLWTEGPKDENISKKLEGADEHFLRSTKRSRVKLPTRYYKKPSRINAVEIPNPGISYNPSFEDHQNLLRKMYNEEKKDMKKEKAIEKWFDFEKVPALKLEQRYLSEMSACLFEEEEEDAEMETKAIGEKDKRTSLSDDEEEEAPLPNPPALAEARKTKRQKRIEKAQKEVERLKTTEKMTKMRMSNVYRLKGLKREIEQEEKGRATKRKRKLERVAKQRGETKKFGKYEFEDVPDAFKLTSQLVGSLRKLKPEGNIIQQRYRHFTKRNILEARIQKKNRKPAFKEYEKKGHKEVTE